MNPGRPARRAKARWRRLGPAGRSSLVFTTAVVGGNLAQLAWLIGGARALPEGHFGTVLAAQALYMVLQVIADNGTSFLGARSSAQATLSDAQRREIARARVMLAGGCALAGLIVALSGGRDLLVAFLPFAAALMLFSVLNVWERYGRGDVVPYAGYLLLRSLFLGGLAGAVALGGGELPLVAAGACEFAAILVVGIGWSAWTLPRGRLRVAASTWRTARDIGLPAVLTQYNVAVGTVALAVAGQSAAAAICGVAFRLLLGLQGLNGAIGSAVFPLLARTGEEPSPHGWASRLAAAAGLVVAGVALSVTAVAAGFVVRVLLDREGSIEEAALLVGVGAAGATGVLMHRSFALVAGAQERLLRSASACGALVVTAGAVAAMFVDGLASSLVVLATYTAGQIVALLIVGSAGAGADRALTIVALAVLPPIAAVMAVSEAARAPLAVAGLVAGAVVGARWLRRGRLDASAAALSQADG